MDFEAAGLLDGLEGKEREARLQLLEQLASDGVGLDELTAAVAENRLALLPVDRVLGGRYSARDVERRTGVPAALMIRTSVLLGLPEPGVDDRVFGDDDIAAARSTQLFLEAGFSEDAILEITQVLGEGMARLAATTAAAFVDTFLRPGDTERDVALRFAALSEQLVPAIGPVLVAAYNQHLRDSVRRGVIGRAERATGRFPDSQQIVVCFADLVGFTRLGGEVGLHELGTVAGGLSRLAADVTAPPVRLVKTIGDAAMFVSPEAEPLVDVALSLLDAVEEADLPMLRAGLASGTALLRAGDYYGNSVNLASRVTGIARPGSVLATEEVYNASLDAFDWSFAGPHQLKGVAGPVSLYRARRLKGSSESTPSGPSKDRRPRRATRRTANRRRTRASR